MARRYASDSSDDGDGYVCDNFRLNPDNLPKGWSIPSALRQRIVDFNSASDDKDITFIRPDGSTERKSIQWCIDNGFSEVRKGVWAGPWYWRGLGEEPPLEGSRVQPPPEEAKWEDSGLMNRIDVRTFALILAIKADANKLFLQGGYGKAVKLYDQAIDMFTTAVLVTPTKQLEERVKILSNKAECLLRLNRNEEADMAAGYALILDDSHEKSRFRRAKANYHIALEARNTGHGTMNALAAAMAEDDFKYIIRTGGPGKADAQTLLDEMNAELHKDLKKFGTHWTA